MLDPDLGPKTPSFGEQVREGGGCEGDADPRQLHHPHIRLLHLHPGLCGRLPPHLVGPLVLQLDQAE